MLIFEKDNKLNISFENQLENPDIEIGKNEINLGNIGIKSDSQVEDFYVNISYKYGERTEDNQLGVVLDKTYDEINEAFLAGKRIWAINWRRYIAPSYTIYGDKSIQEMFIDWYEPMLDENIQDKYIIYHQIKLDKISGTDHVTSHDYEVSATIRSSNG